MHAAGLNFALAALLAAAALAVTPPAVDDLTCTAVDDFQVTVTWTSPAPNFYVYGPDGRSSVSAASATITMPDIYWTTVDVTVAAYNPDGAGPNTTCTAPRPVDFSALLEGDRDAFFSAAGGFAAGHSFLSPALGDYDGDGDRDLLVGTSSHVLLWYENTGSDTAPALEAVSPGPVVLSAGAYIVPAFGDLDGDGDDDLLLGADGSYLYLRNDAGVYSSQTGANNPLNGITCTYCAFAVVDVDGDGDLDVFYGSNLATNLWENDLITGPGGIANPYDGQSTSYAKPALCDVDGDGTLEAFLGGASNGLRVVGGTNVLAAVPDELTYTSPACALGFGSDAVGGIFVGSQGSLQFFSLAAVPEALTQAPAAEPRAGYVNVSWVAPPDNNAAITGYTLSYDDGSEAVALPAAPTWVAVPDVASETAFTVAAANAVGDAAASSASVAVAADAADGAPPATPLDVRCTPGEYQVTVSWTAGGGTASAFEVRGDDGQSATVEWHETEAALTHLSNSAAYTATVVAVDAAGLESAAASCSATPALARAYVDVGGSDSLPGPSALISSSSAPTLFDIDADGDLDLFLGSWTGTQLYINAGDDETWTSDGLEPIDTGTKTGVVPAAGDVDGDGDVDLVVGDFGGELLFFENQGSIYASAFVEVSTIFDVGRYSQPTLVDLDGDGDLDLVSGGEGGELTYIEGDGAGGWTTDIAHDDGPFPWVSDGITLGPAFCDADDDGDLDLLLGSGEDGFLFSENVGSATAPSFGRPEAAGDLVETPTDSYFLPACAPAGFKGAQRGGLIVGALLAKLYWLELVAEPDEVPAVAAVEGHGYVDLAWSPPADDNGVAVTEYSITSSPFLGTRTTDGDTTELRFTGLLADTAFVFEVSAINAAGASVATESDSVVSLGTPDEPQALACVGADNSVSLFWEEPEFNPGGAITAYLVAWDDGDAATHASGLNATIDGLTAWTALNVTVAGVNSNGIGANASCSVARSVDRSTPILGDRDALFAGGLFNVTADDLHPAFLGDDLVIASTSSSLLQRFALLPSSGLYAPVSADALPAGDTAVAFGDLTGDGHPDALFANLTLFAGDGSGGFLADAQVVPLGHTGAPLIADLDRDGLNDVAVGSATDGRIHAYLQLANGSFVADDGSNNPFAAVDAGAGTAVVPCACPDGEFYFSTADGDMGPADAEAGVDIAGLVSPRNAALACSADGFFVGGVASLSWLPLAAHADGVPAAEASVEPGFVNVSWTAALDFGAAVTAYTVNGGGEVQTSRTWAAFPLADPADAYDVVSESAAGPSLAVAVPAPGGAALNATEPPRAPVDVQCRPGDYAVEVRFDYDGGSATSFPLFVDGAEVATTDSGLDNYVAYAVGVAARNAAGDSAVVECAAAVTPRVARAVQAVEAADWLPTMATGARSSPALLGDDLYVGADGVDGLLYFPNASASASASTAASPIDVPAGNDLCAPAFGDWDGDGDSDAVVGTRSGLLLFFASDGAGQFALEATVDDLPGETVPALGDVDGDGDLDLVVGTRGSELLYFERAADSGAWARAKSPFGYLLDDYELAPAFVDWDGDDDADLLVGGHAGVLFVENDFGVFAPTGDSFAVDGETGYRVGDGAVLGTAESAGLFVVPIAGRAADVSNVVVEDFDDATGTATVAWDAPADTGADVTQYTVTEVGSGASVVVTGSPPPTSVAFGGLDGGFSADLEFTVVAANDVGASATASDAAALGSFSATVSATAGGVVVSWDPEPYLLEVTTEILVESDDGSLVWTTTNASTPSVAFAGLECREYAFTVSLAGAELSASTASAVPLDTCPHLCVDAAVAEGEAWIDPTRAAPFQANCSAGNWTVVGLPDAGLSPAQRQAVADLSTHTRLASQGGTGAALLLDTPLFASAANETTATATDEATGATLAAVSAGYTFDAARSSAGGDVGVTAGGALTHDAGDDRWAVNAGCADQLLVAAAAPGVYDSTAALGDWPATATSCGDAAGGLGAVVAAVRTEAVNTTAALPFASPVKAAVDLQRDLSVATQPAAAAVELSVDGGAWTAWADVPADAAAAEGAHEVQVRATLPFWPFEDASPAVVAWEADYTAPLTTFASRPDDYTADTTAVFSLAASEDPVTVDFCVDDVCSTATTDTAAGDPPETVLEAVPSTPVWALPATIAVADAASVEVSVDSGSWLLSAPEVELDGLADGWHAVQVRALDDDTGLADPTPVALGLEVLQSGLDHVAPDTSFGSAPPAVTDASSASLQLNASEPGCAFEVSFDLGASWTNASDVVELAGLEAGFHSVLARATDAAGNADPTPALAAWQVAPAPVATLVLAPESVSPFTQSVFAVEVEGGSGCATTYEVSPTGETGVADAAGVAVVGPLDYGVYSIVLRPVCEQAANELAFEWEVTSEPTELLYTVETADEGVHRATVAGTDPAGNAGPMASLNWTVDLTPPDTLLSAPAAVVAAVDVDLDVGCADALSPCVFVVELDGLDTAAAAAATAELRNLTQGNHTVVVRAEDLAGNADATPATAWFVVDTVAPQLAVTPVAGLLTNAPVFLAETDDAEAAVGWFVDGAAVASGDLRAAGLADGPHALEVVATDVAGNAAAAELAFELDTEPPTAAVEAAPAAFTNDSAAAVAASCADSASACALNGTDVWGQRLELQSLEAWTAAGLADGAYGMQLWAVDAAGNAGAAVAVEWTVDTVAPELAWAALDYWPSGGGLDYELACSDASGCDLWVSVSGEGEGWGAAAAGAVEAATDGEAQLCARAADPAGNAAPETCQTLLFDTVAPAVAFTVAPDPIVSLGVVGVEFAVDELNLAGVACRLWQSAAATWADVACAADELVEVELLGSGETSSAYVFSVRAEDVRGHATEANASWVVDTSPPVVALLDGEALALVNDPAWSVAFSVADLSPWAARCELQFGGAAVEVADPCESPWAVTAGNGDGEYVLLVEATDSAGNAGGANASVALDTVAPVIDVSSAPPTVTISASATLEFQCVTEDLVCGTGDDTPDADCVFTYELNGEAQGAVESPLQLDGLATGSYSLTLSAADAAGNAQSETVVWTVTSDAVFAAFEAVPADPFALTEFEVRMSAEEPFAELQWRLNTGAWSSDGVVVLQESPSTLSAVNVSMPEEFGEQLLEIRVAGFADATTAYTWEYAQCARKDEVQFVGDDGLLICKACRSGDTACAVNGELSAGYWIPPGVVTAPYECPERESCPGWADCPGGDCSATEICAEGYDGVLCALCAPGYADTFGGCQLCPEDGGGSIALVVCVVLFLLSVLVLVLKYSKTIVRGSAFKVVLNFVHMISAIVAFDATWPRLLIDVIDVLGLVNIDFAQITAAGCTDFPVNFYSKWLAALLVPSVIAIGVWGRYAVMRGRANRTAAIRNSLLVLLFLYPGVSGVLIKFFSCREVEGVWYLKEDFSERCFSGTWYGWLSIAGSLTPTFVLGVPLTMFYQLYQHRHTLAEEETVRAIGLLYRSYKHEQYYHEVVSLLYKTMLWVVAVLLSDGVVTQIVLALVLTIIMLVYHLLSWPYNHTEKNVLQLLNYLTACTMCIGGLVMRISDTGGVPQDELDALAAWLDVVVLSQIVVLFAATLSVKALIHRKKRQESRASRVEKAAAGGGGVELGPMSTAVRPVITENPLGRVGRLSCAGFDGGALGSARSGAPSTPLTPVGPAGSAGSVVGSAGTVGSGSGRSEEV